MTPLHERSVKNASSEPLSAVALDGYLAELPGWTGEVGAPLRKSWSFPDFATALAFVNRIAVEAEAGYHHPDIVLKWGHVGIALFTHDADALTMKDVVLAARIDALD
jgi:4a-hydroxytetrahydrobiopterin dehydratase